MNRWLLLSLFAIVHAFIFMVVQDGAFPDEGENPLYFFYASNIFDGQLPYQDFSIEYPPVSLILFVLPRIVTDTGSEYHVAFAVEMLIFDLAGLVIIASMAERLGSSSWKSLLAYTLFLLAIGPIITGNFDLAAATLVLFSLYAFSRGWNTMCWVVLAIGVMTKIYPIILAPVLMIYLLKRKEIKKMLRGGIVLGLTLFIIALPCLMISPSGFYDSFDYHAERGLQIESTGASLLLIGDVWGLGSEKPIFDYGAYELGGSVADSLTEVIHVIMLLAMGMLYFHYFRDWAIPSSETNDIFMYSTLAIMIFLFINKVFSPQYIIWLYPLIPLIITRYRSLIWIAFIILGLLTRYIYPENYGDLINMESHMVYILFLRNAILLGMIVWMWRWRQSATTVI